MGRQALNPFLADKTQAHFRSSTLSLEAGTSLLRRLNHDRKEQTNDQHEHIKRRRYSFRRHRYSGFRSGWCLIRAGQPVRFRIATAAASKQKLFSRSGFRAALPGTALWLERREGPVKGRRPGAFFPAVRKLAGTLYGDSDYSGYAGYFE